MTTLLRIFLIAGLATAVCGCGKKKSTGTSGNASLAFANAQGSSLLAGGDKLTPTYFGIKMINVSLVTDNQPGANGTVSSIYLNKACGSADETTEINGKSYKYVGVPDCSLDKVTTFFDLARASSVVNADLNSQALPIQPGTYNYVMMGLCTGTPNQPNISFQVSGMTAAAGISVPECVQYSTKFAAPLVVNDGDAVTVTLTYDLTNTILESTGMTSTACATDSGIEYCSGMPPLNPSASR